MPQLSLTTAALEELAVDAIIAPIEATGEGPALLAPEAWPPQAAKALAGALSAIGATGKPGEVLKLPAPKEVEARAVIVTGVSKAQADKGDPTLPDAPEALRRAAGEAARQAGGFARIALAFPANNAREAAAAAVGAALGAYRCDDYRTTKDPAPPREILLAGPAARIEGVAEALTRALAVSQEVARTRDLVNTPANHLTPDGFAELARERAEEMGIKVTILDEDDLAKAGHGAICGVGKGSSHPPRLVKLAWNPGKAPQTLAIVGKGITFDSGGLSIKSAKGMETMKSDMAGAAVVLGTILLAARLQAPQPVVGYLALAENMPSGTAQRPGDIVTALDGTTIEVLNTDAEGRLVLADAIAQARLDGADAIIDIATLTGSQIAALGDKIGGAMGETALREQVLAAAREVGEPLWPMPLPAPLARDLDSTIADVKNIGGPHGGMLLGGLFLQRFAKDVPWVHLDIAGPAFNESKPYGYVPAGGTAWGLRTLITLVTSHFAS